MFQQMHPRMLYAINRFQDASKQGVVRPRTATRAWQLLRAVEVWAPDSLHWMDVRSLEITGAMGNVVLTFDHQSGYLQVEIPPSGPALWYGSLHSFDTSWTAEFEVPTLPDVAKTYLRKMTAEVPGE